MPEVLSEKYCRMDGKQSSSELHTLKDINFALCQLNLNKTGRQADRQIDKQTSATGRQEG